MRAFYVPELDSNVLQVNESAGNPSIVVNRLNEVRCESSRGVWDGVTEGLRSYMSFVASFLNLCGNGA